MILSKKFRQVLGKYESFKTNPLTKSSPLYAIMKYLYINTLLYPLKLEITIHFLGTLKAKIKKGDGIVGNFHSGLHEADDSIFLIHLVRPDDSFLDIGANVGHYTLLTGSYLSCKVIAVEPIPETFDRLNTNVLLNTWKHKPKLLNIGLSDENGALFFTNKSFTTNKVSKNETGIKVSVKTLDEICQEITPDFIKIDVEGYEWFVLKGGLVTLSNGKVKVIIIELNESGVHFGIQDRQIIEFLNQLGYFPYVYHVEERLLEEVAYQNTKQFNTLFIKDIEFVRNRVLNGKKLKLGSLEF